MEISAAQRFSYGAAGHGNLKREMTDELSWQILETAWDAGIRHFDTAPHYGIGLSEHRLGEFLRTKPRDEYILSTKVGRILEPLPEVAGDDMENLFQVPRTHVRRYDYTLAGVRRSLEESLERLGLDRVDILYLHDPEKSGAALDATVGEGMQALGQLRAEGLVAAVGVGSMSVPALVAGTETGVADLHMIAGRYTLLEQPTESGLLQRMLERGVKGHVVSVYNSGILAQRRPPATAHYDYAQVSPELLQRANRIADICEEHGVDLPTAALAYPLQHEAIVAVGIGASRPQHVIEGVARFEIAVPETLWDALRTAGLVA